MESKWFQKAAGDRVHYLCWSIPKPRVAVVISHGMVEHPKRYDALATFLNTKGIAVYGIYHIGHGAYAKIPNHMEPGDFDRCIENLHGLVELAHKETGKPVILLGHSMGSFMSQLYITRYDDLAALILSGSTKAAFMEKAGAVFARVLYVFTPDRTKPSKLMNSLAFGGYNKAFPNAKTEFDWLSRDEEQVKKYVADPYCGGICSVSFFRNLTGGMAAMGKKKLLKHINKALPIYIQGGGSDPVSRMGKGLYELEQQYRSLGVQQVKLDVYEDARHEIFNELNRQQVYENTLAFIESVLADR